MVEASVGTASHGNWAMPAAFGSSRSKRILVFGDVGGTGGTAHRLLRQLSDRGHLSIESRLSGAAKPDGRLLREWHRQERHCSAISLGIIAAVGSGTTAVRQIMIGGCEGGPVPGAIALLGHDRSLVEALLSMAGREANSPIAMEWPPLLVFLSAGDPQIADCARACRMMRSVGIPAALEIVEVDLTADADLPGEAGLADFAAELDRFFSEHLIADFPKLFG